MLKKGEQKIAIDENGDIFKNDAMGRQSVIEDLSKLIEKTADSVVFSLNSSWGTGKTTFVRLWGAYLKQQGIQNFYFSAWENDFSKDPLVTILGEFQQYIKENEIKGAEKSLDRVKEVGSKILKNAVAELAKKATGDIVDISPLIDEYPAQKDALKEFKDSIQSVINDVYSEYESNALLQQEAHATSDSKPESEPNPFVIFIDELDRCRPLYAIECLERIKHLFGINRLVFILSIDKEQLSESIKSQYGNIDANQYLKRFIDIEYKLTNDYFDGYFQVLYNKFELNNSLLSKSDNWRFFDSLTKILNISLRELEQLFLRFNICAEIIRKFNHFECEIFLFLEMLRSYDSNLYNDFIKGDKKDEVRKLFSQQQQINAYTSALIDLIIEATALDKDGYKKLEENYSIRRKELAENKKNDDEYYKLDDKLWAINEILTKQLRFKYFNDIIKKVIEKIDFADRFKFNT